MTIPPEVRNHIKDFLSKNWLVLFIVFWATYVAYIHIGSK